MILYPLFLLFAVKKREEEKSSYGQTYSLIGNQRLSVVCFGDDQPEKQVGEKTGDAAGNQGD
jgi:hypothetical protein